MNDKLINPREAASCIVQAFESGEDGGLHEIERFIHDIVGQHTEALRDRIQAIIDWCDFALANPDEFNKHGVRNLDGPVFDTARQYINEMKDASHE